MISPVKYFRLWSKTIIWGNFWKSWQKVAFWAVFYQKKDDFCWYSSWTAYFFCQIFGIEMIQYLHSKKMSKTSKRRLFWLFIAQKIIILADLVCFDMISCVKYFHRNSALTAALRATRGTDYYSRFIKIWPWMSPVGRLEEVTGLVLEKFGLYCSSSGGSEGGVSCY